MKIETSVGLLEIKWQHRRIHHNKMDWYNSEPLNAITKCRVIHMNVEAVGEAKCDMRDNFNKETGRKLSLARAIEMFPKNVRTEIWDSYLNRKQHDKEERIHCAYKYIRV